MRGPDCDGCRFYARISLGGYLDHFLCVHPQMERPLLLKDAVHPPARCPLLRRARDTHREGWELPVRRAV